jgi:predicted solute-binding protein
MLGKADAALIIGDPALRVSLAADEYAPVPIEKKSFWKRAEASPASEEPLDVLDVVGEWRKLTDLPAVLAIWAGRREVITPEVMADFVSSREYGLMRIAEISKSAAGQLGLPAADLEAYLRENIDFGLDAENQKGLTDFYRRAALMGLTPTAKPIEWAAVIDGHLAASQHVGD